jgi:hypothetical protein
MQFISLLLSLVTQWGSNEKPLTALKIADRAGTEGLTHTETLSFPRERPAPGLPALATPQTQARQTLMADARVVEAV